MDYPKKVIPVKKDVETKEFNQSDKCSKESEINDKSEILIQEDLREIFKE